MYASKKYMNEMIARYSLPGTRPIMNSNYANPGSYRPIPATKTVYTPPPLLSAPVSPQKIVKVDPNIELAKLQRQRQQLNIQRINAAKKLNRPKNNSNFVADRRRPYDDVKISRLARGTSRIVKSYDRLKKI